MGRGKEGDRMPEMVLKIRNLQLPPQQLRELGLKPDWNKRVSPEFVASVVEVAERYKDVLKELSRR